MRLDDVEEAASVNESRCLDELDAPVSQFVVGDVGLVERAGLGTDA